MVEFLVGKFDLNEGVFVCVVCELCEEIGYMVCEYVFFVCIYLIIFYLIEFIDLYFVCGLMVGECKFDEGEFFEIFIVMLVDL